MIDPIHPDLLPLFTFGVCSTTDGQMLPCRYASNNFLITYIVSLFLNEDSGLGNSRNCNFSNFLMYQQMRLLYEYIAEFFVQIIYPLIKCEINNTEDINKTKLPTFQLLKWLGNILLSLRAINHNNLQNFIDLTFSEILKQLWQHIPQNSLLILISKAISPLIIFMHDTSQVGLLKCSNLLPEVNSNRYSSNNPVISLITSLHMQLIFYFLTGEALLKHFDNIQKLAWECHPLYRSDLAPPPHCRIASKEAFKELLKLIGVSKTYMSLILSRKYNYLSIV